jgi:hypothetical protein
MLDTRNIYPLSDFQRNAKDFGLPILLLKLEISNGFYSRPT